MQNRHLLTETRILITGFGAFPGVAANASAGFSRAVAETLLTQIATRSGQPIDVHCAELRVDWHTIHTQIAALYEQVQPALAIHIGVCTSANGLVVERQAHNACALEQDATGHLPLSEQLARDSNAVLKTHLPVNDLVANVADGSVELSVSDDAGRYLCNAAYYTSLVQTAQQAQPGDAVFIHIPSDLRANMPSWTASVATAQRLILAALACRQAPRQ